MQCNFTDRNVLALAMSDANTVRNLQWFSNFLRTPLSTTIFKGPVTVSSCDVLEKD